MQRGPVLFYIAALGTGGAERVVATLANGLQARGWAVTIAVDHTASGEGQTIDPAIALVTLPQGHAASIRALSRLLGELRPAAALGALGSSNLKLALAALPSGMLGRVILTYHGLYGIEPRLLSRMGYRLLPLLSRMTGATVAVSDALRQNLIAACGASPARLHVIHNPIPLEGRNGTDAAKLAARPPLVLAAGRLSPEKDFAALIAAFAQVKTPGAQLRIMGEGPARAQLASRIAALNLAGRVSLPGYREDLSQEYDSARCFALASVSEAFGNVIVEALAHGLPVVATACGGPQEILDGGRFGSLVPVGDVPALAQALDAALADPGDPAPRMARAQDFSAGAIISRYEDLIASVRKGGN